MEMGEIIITRIMVKAQGTVQKSIIEMSSFRVQGQIKHFRI